MMARGFMIMFHTPGGSTQWHTPGRWYWCKLCYCLRYAQVNSRLLSLEVVFIRIIKLPEPGSPVLLLEYHHLELVRQGVFSMSYETCDGYVASRTISCHD